MVYQVSVFGFVVALIHSSKGDRCRFLFFSHRQMGGEDGEGARAGRCIPPRFSAPTPPARTTQPSSTKGRGKRGRNDRLTKWSYSFCVLRNKLRGSKGYAGNLPSEGLTLHRGYLCFQMGRVLDYATRAIGSLFLQRGAIFFYKLCHVFHTVSSIQYNAP